MYWLGVGIVALGSSPLARGTQPAFSSAQAYLGLIPARAGNTGIGPTKWPRCRAHPRSRGEHCHQLNLLWNVLGSSPLARGTPGPGATWQLLQGLIPARAGNTVCAFFRRRDCRAHPRSRGEHLQILDIASRMMGSSPLARGTQQKTHPGRGGSGLIPARAGNTGLIPGGQPGGGAHPRSRGEHRG